MFDTDLGSEGGNTTGRKCASLRSHPCYRAGFRLLVQQLIYDRTVGFEEDR
jgi:hypothetical protein